MQLNSEIFGYAYKLPTRIDSSEEVSLFEDKLGHTYSLKQLTSEKVEGIKNSRFIL